LHLKANGLLQLLMKPSMLLNIKVRHMSPFKTQPLVLYLLLKLLFGNLWLRRVQMV
tara:strand:- start:306 stop:473 length:168 start_codon:yes stop_codon:yes gene_type:complete